MVMFAVIFLYFYFNYLHIHHIKYLRGLLCSRPWRFTEAPQHSEGEGKQIFDFESSFVYIQESCPTEKKTLKKTKQQK